MKTHISIERVVTLMWKHQTPTQRRHNEVDLKGFIGDLKRIHAQRTVNMATQVNPKVRAKNPPAVKAHGPKTAKGKK